MPIPRERVEIALEGGKPDRVPIVPIYDFGYLTKCTGHDPREYVTASSAERIRLIEEAFLRHEVDGIFVHSGTTDEWANSHTIEKCDGYWLVTNTKSGATHRLLPDGWGAEADGTQRPRAPSHDGVSRIQSADDLDRVVPPPPTEEDIAKSGRSGPLRNFVEKYPDHHFSFQTGTPMVSAVGHCGGYVEALTTLATDRDLFKELVRRCAPHTLPVIAQGKKAGGRSAWFTSYYMAADSISPKDYAEIVFPFEQEVCQAAKEQGLYVLNWFLGDLMPILDKVMELPLDALVLEQGRKGYEIDPVEIRRRVGPKFCLFGFGYERDYCEFNRVGLSAELRRQFEGAGRDGAFIAGTPIMPPNAQPEAVDFYFAEARRIGVY